MLEVYSDEILSDEEPILLETVDCGPELIEYFNNTDRAQAPWVTRCCICKDVKNKNEWVPAERAIISLPPDTQFSHGLCERCLRKSQLELSLEIAAAKAESIFPE